MIVAGIGCRAGCPAEDILALVAEAAGRSGVVVTCLAAPERRRGEPGVRRAASVLGVPLLWIGLDRLRAAEPLCPTRSARVRALTGAASVAEGCAVAAAGAGGRLLLPRIASARATCALAAGRAG
jgi:cobalt-precorrin 5A hydrolase